MQSFKYLELPGGLSRAQPLEGSRSRASLSGRGGWGQEGVILYSLLAKENGKGNSLRDPGLVRVDDLIGAFVPLLGEYTCAHLHAGKFLNYFLTVIQHFFFSFVCHHYPVLSLQLPETQRPSMATQALSGSFVSISVCSYPGLLGASLLFWAEAYRSVDSRRKYGWTQIRFGHCDQ